MMSFFKKALSPFRRVGQETAVPTAPSIASRIAAASAVVVFALPAVGFARDNVEYRVEAKRWGEVETSYRDPYGNRLGRTQRVVPGGTVETQWGRTNYQAQPYGRKDRCAPGERKIWVKDGHGNVYPSCSGQLRWQTPPQYVPDN
ncbi:MAG: hypothetical protein PHW63_04690 [Alphaproteobacteria bacterium]|nr:hypothetical protein [Alphaproteobacteria bacterium]